MFIITNPFSYSAKFLKFFNFILHRNFYERRCLFIMENPEVIRDSLAQCIGTSQYWKIFPGDFQFYITDGVKAMYEMCEALWLVSAIFFDVHKDKIRREDFVVYKLTVNKDRSAVLVAEDGNYHKLSREEFTYTDFPLSEGIMLYWCDNVLMLPSEY